MKKKLLYTIALALMLNGCSSKKWVLTDSTAIAIPIDSSTEELADPRMKAYLEPIKAEVEKEMNQVIAQTDEELTRGWPESLLSNWNADNYLLSATEYMGEQVDLAVVNMGSLRAPIPKGDVTVGDIFRLMPFENELVILWLTGTEIQKLFDIFALEGGQGLAGAQFGIKDKKAVNSLIQGKKIDPEKLYSVATNDFLAGGNDRMIPLTTAVKRVDTGLKIRNILMEAAVRAGQKEEKIESKLDRRIYIVE